MRQPVQGWRSARAQPRAHLAVSLAGLTGPAPTGQAAPPVIQPPFKIGLGMTAMVFYLWIIHSYKLPLGDVAVVSTLIGVLIRARTLRFPAPLMIFGLFILWGCVGLGVTSSVAITWASLLDLIKLWVILFCLLNLVHTAAELRFFSIAWLAIFALYPVRGVLYNQYICHCAEFGRVSFNFVFENPNDMAAFCLFPLGMSASIGYGERAKLWKWAGIIGIGVLSLCIILTQSRGVIIAMAAALLLLPLLSRNRSRDFLLIALLSGAAVIAAPKTAWERLAGLSKASVSGGMADVDPEGSAELRWKIWQVAAQSIREKPVMGVGAGMMPYVHAQLARQDWTDWYLQGVHDTHSTYLRVAAEFGIPGLGIYLVMWGSLMWHVNRARRRTRHTRPREHQMLLFLQLAVVAYLVASFFGTYAWIAFTYLAIGTTWVAASVLQNEPWYEPHRAGTQASSPVPVRRSR